MLFDIGNPICTCTCFTNKILTTRPQHKGTCLVQGSAPFACSLLSFKNMKELLTKNVKEPQETSLKQVIEDLKTLVYTQDHNTSAYLMCKDILSSFLQYWKWCSDFWDKVCGSGILSTAWHVGGASAGFAASWGYNLSAAGFLLQCSSWHVSSLGKVSREVMQPPPRKYSLLSRACVVYFRRALSMPLSSLSVNPVLYTKYIAAVRHMQKLYPLRLGKETKVRLGVCLILPN